MNDPKTLLTEKLKDMRSCMFITMAGTDHKGRPMATQDIEFDGSVWFMTDKRSTKCTEIAANPSVCLSYSHSNGVRFAILSGKAAQVEDKTKIKEFWNDFYKAWFEGPDDPNITLIRVDVRRAEYWDNKGGKIGAFADMALGAVTGETNKLDEHEVLTF